VAGGWLAQNIPNIITGVLCQNVEYTKHGNFKNINKSQKIFGYFILSP
jgi:hypothetical protein